MTQLANKLMAARALISTPDKWASNESERRIAAGGCRLCAYDAVTEIAPFERGQTDAVLNILKAAIPKSYRIDPDSWTHPVAIFNDDPSTTHADVMALFDRAIAAAKAT